MLSYMNLSDTIHQQTKFNYFLQKKKKLNLIIANAFSSESLSLKHTHSWPIWKFRKGGE